MVTNSSTIQRFLLTGLLGLWGLFATVAFAGKAPQGLSDAQWHNIQRQIQENQQNDVIPEAHSLTLSETKLLAGDGVEGDCFGWSVSLDGNRLAIGAMWADVGGNKNQGAVYLFNFKDNEWKQSTKIIAIDGAADDYFGRSVSLNNNRLIVGAHFADINNNNDQGAVYIFDFSGSSWIQSQKLTANDGNAGDLFGTSVVSNHNHIAIGSIMADSKNMNQGAVYIFDFNGSNWEQSQKLTANDGMTDDRFGTSIDINNKHLVVGAYRDDMDNAIDQGSAYVFEFNGSSWSQSQKFVADDGAISDRFGNAVALNNNRIAVGAYYADIGSNTNQGATYLFDFEGSSWIQSEKITADDGTVNEYFGGTVSLKENRLAVGVRTADINDNPDQGAVYLFDLIDNSWKQSDKIVAQDGRKDDSFGWSVDLDDNRLVVGANWADIDYNRRQGSVYIYDELPTYYVNGLSGTWYDPAYDGSGYNLVQLPNGLLVYYYGYKKNGNGAAQWLLSDIIPGTVAAGKTYAATMYAGTPGNGVTLESCNKGRVRLTGADGSVSHNIIPLATIAGLNCTSSTTNAVSYTAPSLPAGTFSGLAGTWYDPVYDGSGFNVIQIPNGLLLYYYGYQAGANGQALWLLSDVITQPITAGTTLNVDLYAGFIGNGGSFTQKPTKGTSGLTRWGQAEITFNQCNAGTIRLIGSNASVTHNIVPLASINGVTCSN